MKNGFVSDGDDIAGNGPVQDRSTRPPATGAAQGKVGAGTPFLCNARLNGAKMARAACCCSGRITRCAFLHHAARVGMLAAVPARAAPTGRPGATIQVASDMPAGAIKPVTVSEIGGPVLLCQTGEFPLMEGPDLVLRPALATAWAPNGDCSVWTFKLRPGRGAVCGALGRAGRGARRAAGAAAPLHRAAARLLAARQEQAGRQAADDQGAAARAGCGRGGVRVRAATGPRRGAGRRCPRRALSTDTWRGAISRPPFPATVEEVVGDAVVARRRLGGVPVPSRSE